MHYLQILDGYEVRNIWQLVLGEVESALIETLLDYTNGNQGRAARLLGISRSTLRKKMALYEIQLDRYKPKRSDTIPSDIREAVNPLQRRFDDAGRSALSDSANARERARTRD